MVWIDELWLYLNTDTDQVDDVAYAMQLARLHDWVKWCSRPHDVPIFAQKQRNTCYFYRYAANEPDTIFVRFDDDVIYIHPGTVASMVNHQLASTATATFPIIINNARVSYLLQKQGKIPDDWGEITDDCMDGVGWGNGAFATLLHQKLIGAIWNEDGGRGVLHPPPHADQERSVLHLLLRLQGQHLR